MAASGPDPRPAPAAAVPALRWVDQVPAELADAVLLLLGDDELRRGVVVQDSSGVIVAANLAAERLLGLSWDQMIGVTSMDVRWQAVSERGVPLPGEQHPAIIALTEQRSVVGALMGVLVPSRGMTAWLEVTAHPLFAGAPLDSLGSASRIPCGVVALFDDVSSSPRGITAFGALVSAYRLLADNSSDIVFRADAHELCEWISPSIEHMTGWRPIELVGKSMIELLHPDDTAMVMAVRAAAAAVDASTAGATAGSTPGVLDRRYVVRFRHRDGSYRWYSAVSRREIVDGRPAETVVVSMRDVDAQVRAQAELEASERHYRMLADNSSDVIVHVRDGYVQWISPAVRTVLGREPDALVGVPVTGLVAADDAWLIASSMQELIAGSPARHTMRWYLADGTTGWFDVVARLFVDDQGVVDGVVLRLRDVSAEVESRARLEYQARHDQLTGLVNRHELAERLSTILTGSGLGQGSLAVAFCDVDHFKTVNDTYGHEGGDHVLQQVGDRISGAVRSGDIVARLGGDELVVVLHGVSDLGHAMAAADKVRRSVEAPLQFGGQQVFVTLSVGVSLARPGDDVEALIRRADNAVYSAKQSGRNRVETFDQPC